MTTQKPDGWTVREEQMIVPIENLYLSPYNPRKRTADVKFSELKKSIGERGVLVPLLVRRQDPDKPNRFEIIGGGRRFRAAGELGFKDVPCLVKQMTDKEAQEIAILENLQREDVHPLDEAVAYKDLLKKGYSRETISEKVGKPIYYIYQRDSLNNLCKKAENFFRQNTMTIGHASLLARVPEDQQEMVLSKSYSFESGAAHGSVRELQIWMHEHLHQDLSRAPFPLDDGDLFKKAGSCLECPKRSGSKALLFPDVEKGDVCTDPPCFNQKLDSFLVREVTRNQKAPADVKLVYLSTSWDDKAAKKQNAVRSGQWERAKRKSCEHVEEGILVDGHERGKTVTVCAAPKCKKHRGAYLSGSSGSYRDEQKAADFKKKVHHKSVLAVVQAVVMRLTDFKSLSRADWELIVTEVFGRVWHEDKQRILKIWYPPVEGKPEKKINVYEWPGKGINKFSQGDLARLLLMCGLMPSFHSTQYDAKERTKFFAMAKRHRVNADKIFRDIREEAQKKKRKTKKGAKKNDRPKS